MTDGAPSERPGGDVGAATLGRESQVRLLDGKYRDLFEQILWICYRYGVDLNELEPEKLRALLEKELAGLTEIHPYIALRAALQDPESGFDLEDGNLSYGVYYLAEPAIKILNSDDFLGYQGTNNFVAELHEEIQRTLNGSGSVKALSSDVRGGGFLCNLNKLAESEDEQAALRQLRLKSQLVQRNAKEVLLRHLRKRFTELDEKIRSEYVREGESEAVDRSKEIERLEGQLENVGHFIERFEPAQGDGEVPIDEQIVHIAFGERLLDHSHRNPALLFRAMMSAKFAARMGILRTHPSGMRSETGYKRSIWHRFDYIHMLSSLVRMRYELDEVVLDDSGQIISEWQPFFELDGTGSVRMTQDAISYYRANGKKPLGATGDYKGKERKDFDDRLAFFARYYQIINILDELKGFRFEKMHDFLERVDNILDIIKEIKKALASDDTENEVLIDLLNRAAVQQEISTRDEGEGVMLTTRAFIKGLMASGESQPDAPDTQAMLIMVADVIGGGVDHQLDLESASIGLTAMLRSNDGEYPTNTVISDKLAYVGKSNVAEILLKSGDVLTKMIIDFVNSIVSTVTDHECQCTVDTSGGDEITVVIKGPADKVADVRKLLEDREFDRLRKVFFESRTALAPVLKEIKDVPISAEVRRPIARLAHILAQAEVGMERAKASEPKVDLRLQSA